MGWGHYYEDYGYSEPPEPDPIPGAIRLDGPIHAHSRRGPIGVEWWGQQWVAAVERVRGDARLDRGKRYARNGSVLDMQIGHGQVFAHVQGSRDRVYHSYVELKKFTKKEWKRALDALAEQAIYTAKLLAGEMPGDIEAIFDNIGTSLFPRSSNDILFDCSCPDWGDPCKHSAAMYYLLAEQLDADPFLLFHLRGLKREAVLTELRKRRGTTNIETPTPDAIKQEFAALDEDLAKFWSGSTINLVRTVPVRNPTPFIFRQLGPPPLHQHAFNQLYDDVASDALLWLGLSDDEVEERDA